MKRVLLLVLTALLGVAMLSGTAAAADPTTIIAAGDIACGVTQNVVTPTTCQEAATAARAAQVNAKYALLLGDIAYPRDSLADLQGTFAPTWGKLKAALRPTPGNHDGLLTGFTDYDKFFGARATPLQPGCTVNCLNYYSFNTGSWHIDSINTSMCNEITGVCDAAALANELTWLKADLAEHPNKCNLAFMHNPLFAAGVSRTLGTKPIYDVLQGYGVDVVLAAHAHEYERFAAQTPAGVASPTGITEIIAGTGGDNEQPLAPMVANEVTQFDAFGVVKMVLGAGTWHTQFDNINGTVQDPTNGTCHYGPLSPV